MAQNTILAAGATTATSTDVVVAAGATVTIGIFRDAGDLPDYAVGKVYIDTPGADAQVAVLTDNAPVTVLAGPGTFRVVRPSNSFAVNIGVFTET